MCVMVIGIIKINGWILWKYVCYGSAKIHQKLIHTNKQTNNNFFFLKWINKIRKYVSYEEAESFFKDH